MWKSRVDTNGISSSSNIVILLSFNSAACPSLEDDSSSNDVERTSLKTGRSPFERTRETGRGPRMSRIKD